MLNGRKIARREKKRRRKEGWKKGGEGERERDMVGWHRKENKNGKVKEFRLSPQRNKSFSGNVSFSP